MADGDTEDEAAQAFESLRAEVSLMRRAVERLAAERAEGSHAPDYSETLGVISQNLSATAQRVDALVKSPALSLSGITFGQQHVGRPLLTPDEVRTLSPDRQLLFLAGQRPVIAAKLRYYADREFAGRYDQA